VRQIFSRLLIDLSWNSSRLEGNTYSLLETERLLELGEAAEGKDALEAQMILNHKAAIELLRDLFVWAYERSCARYSAVRQSLGEPDPFRMRYRHQVAGIVAELVRNGKDKKQATAVIKRYAKQNVKGDDQTRFVEVVETELMSLHEGNIARYRLRPAEYRAWRENWS
jgi:Fic family protein